MGLRLAQSIALRLARATALFVCFLIAVLALGCFACLAQAQPEEVARGPLALHWVRLAGAEPCISGDALARAVEAKLRRGVFPAPRDASILIEGSVTKGQDGFHAELRMTNAEGELLGSRSLSSNDASCAELSETLTVVLAVMIDPDAAKRAPTAPPAPAQEESATAAPANHMLAFARVVLGFTRKPLIGFGGAYERALGAAGGLRVEAALFLENADKKPASNLPDDATAFVRLSYAGVAYCPLWLAYSRVRLSGCTGVELGVLEARDDGFPPANDAKDQRAFWGSASAAARVSIVLVGRLEAHLAASFLGAFGHKLYVIDQQDERVYILPKERTRPIGGAFDLGLGARF